MTFEGQEADTWEALCCGLWLQSLKSLLWMLLRKEACPGVQTCGKKVSAEWGGRTPVGESESFTPGTGEAEGCSGRSHTPGPRGHAAPRVCVDAGAPRGASGGWVPGPRVEHRGEFQGVVSTPLFTGAPLWTPSRTCHLPSEGDRRAIRPGSRPRRTATAAQAARVGSGYAGRGPPFAAAKSSPTSPQRNEGLSCFCRFLDQKLQPSLHFPVGHSFSQKLPTAPPSLWSKLGTGAS